MAGQHHVGREATAGVTEGLGRAFLWHFGRGARRPGGRRLRRGMLGADLQVGVGIVEQTCYGRRAWRLRREWWGCGGSRELLSAG